MKMTDEAVFAGVYVLDLPLTADKIYEYAVPKELCGEVKLGSLVRVPFSKGNKSRLAVVVRLGSVCEYKNVKPVLSVATDRISLNEEMLGLCSFLKERTFCTFTDAVRTAVGPVDKIADGKLAAVRDYSYFITGAGKSASIRGSLRQKIISALKECSPLSEKELRR